MKEINDHNVNMDAIFDGRPFGELDAATQAYVLKEFGSQEEYETMCSSFKRIRTAMDDEEEIVADDKVRAELLALFEEDEDRKVVPLIPRQTGGGLSFLRSPYFQLGVAACLVLVALFFVPWNGTNNQAEMNFARLENKETTGAKNEREAVSGALAEDSDKNIPAKNGELLEDAKQGPDDKGRNDKGEYKNSDLRLSDAVAEESEPGRNEEFLKQEEFSSLNSAKPNQHLENQAYNTNTTVNKDVISGSSNTLAGKAVLDEKSKMKEQDDESQKVATKKDKSSRYNANREEERRKQAPKRDNNISSDMSVPAAVSGESADGVKGKDGVGVSLGDKKDLMQFFFTAL